METKLSEKDAYAAQLSCLVTELKGQLVDLDTNSKLHTSNLETDLSKEKALVKSLRQQVTINYYRCFKF